MLKAIILKVERNANDPQVNFNVSFIDDEMTPEFQVTQVFTLPVDDELNDEKVRNVIQQRLKELSDGVQATLQKEQQLRDTFQGMEITL